MFQTGYCSGSGAASFQLIPSSGAELLHQLARFHGRRQLREQHHTREPVSQFSTGGMYAFSHHFACAEHAHAEVETDVEPSHRETAPNCHAGMIVKAHVRSLLHLRDSAMSRLSTRKPQFEPSCSTNQLFWAFPGGWKRIRRAILFCGFAAVSMNGAAAESCINRKNQGVRQ